MGNQRGEQANLYSQNIRGNSHRCIPACPLVTVPECYRVYELGDNIGHRLHLQRAIASSRTVMRTSWSHQSVCIPLEGHHRGPGGRVVVSIS
jgi:hypothetical protein